MDKKQFNLLLTHKVELSDEERARRAERFKNAQPSGHSGEGRQEGT